MDKIVLVAERRDMTGKQTRQLRRAGRVPAVIYGKGFTSMPITLDMREVTRALPHITSSQLITIDLEGEQHTALVRERQRSPIRKELLHVDFQAVSMTETLRTTVGLQFTGDAPAVVEQMGVLVTGVEEIDVEALPGDLPERILVDISGLEEIGMGIYVKDLNVPKGVQVLTDPEELVAFITTMMAEEEVEEAVEEEVEYEEGMEPERIERGTAEEEEESTEEE